MRVTWAGGPRLAGAPALERAAQAALAHGGRPGLDVDVVVLDDAALAELHRRFLDDASPTDVMAFDLGTTGGAGEGDVPGDAGERGPAAEVYVSAERALAVARRRGVAPERELALYVVHGALHLCGLDDGDESARSAMRAAEAAVLSALGYAPDTAPHDVEDRVEDRVEEEDGTGGGDLDAAPS